MLLAPLLKASRVMSKTVMVLAEAKAEQQKSDGQTAHSKESQMPQLTARGAAAQIRRAEKAEARASMLEQLIVDLMYATDHVEDSPLLDEVRRATAISIPTLVGHAGAPHKAKPSWDK